MGLVSIRNEYYIHILMQFIDGKFIFNSSMFHLTAGRLHEKLILLIGGTESGRELEDSIDF